MGDYSKAIEKLPWFNTENVQKAIEAAEKAGNHLETMELHKYDLEIYEVERRRLHAQIGQITKLWNWDMQEWLLEKVRLGLIKQPQPV